MEIGQSTWSHQTAVLSERDGSEEEIFLTQSSFGGSLEPSNPMESLCKSSDESHCKTRMFAVRRWRCCKAAAVMNFPFEGHCAMTNADETNEVQENAVTAKKGKKRSINAITSFQVNNP